MPFGTVGAVPGPGMRGPCARCLRCWGCAPRPPSFVVSLRTPLCSSFPRGRPPPPRGLLTTRHRCPPPPPPRPKPLKRLGQIFFRAIGRSKVFSGTFGTNYFRPEIFFGAFSASKNSAPPEGLDPLPPSLLFSYPTAPHSPEAHNPAVTPQHQLAHPPRLCSPPPPAAAAAALGTPSFGSRRPEVVGGRIAVTHGWHWWSARHQHSGCGPCSVEVGHTGVRQSSGH